jgi:hypothetical protein
MATIASPALIVLDDIHLRLSVTYTSAGVAPVADRPSDQWVALIQDLFQFGHCGQVGNAWFGQDDPPAWAPAARGIRAELARTGDAERRVLGRLLLAAGTTLHAATIRLTEQVELAGRVHRKPRPFALVPTDATYRLARIGMVSMLFVRHARPDTLDRLIPAGPDLVKWARSAHEGGISRLPDRYFEVR